MSYHHHDELAREPEAIPLIEQAAPDYEERLNVVSQAKWRPGRDLQSWRSAPMLTILTAATGILLVTTILSGIVTLTHSLSRNNKGQDGASRMSVTVLRRPSLYLGLERVPEIKHNGLTFGSSYNAEGGIMHTDASASMDAAVSKSMSRVSSVFPDTKFKQDGWVYVTETDHTIFNFTIPSGSGANCVLHASFPSRQAIAASDALLTLEGSSESTVVLTALQFDSTSRLEDLTWSTRPSSIRTLGSLRMIFGTVHDTEGFACSTSDEWMLVEAACQGSGCRIEYKYLDSIEGAKEPIGIELRRA